MSSEKPLNVRVAEALGWTGIEGPTGSILSRSGQRYVGRPPGSLLLEKSEVPYFGEDTPEGWACTGPLIGHFGLTVYCRRDGFGPRRAGYEAARPDKSPMDVSENACAAVAEWAAHYGSEK